jgi:hypothetical protein
MRAIRRAASAALLGTAALAPVPWALPAAAAPRPGAGSFVSAGTRGDGDFRARIAPRVIAAGGQVMLTVRGCRGETRVSSGILGTVRLGAQAPPTPVAVGRAARPGAGYEVTFRCADGRLRTVGLTVARGPGTDPHQAVGAGTGARGTAHARRATGRLGGFDVQQIAVGTLLLAGALALAYRRSSRHATGEPAPAEPTAAHRTGS